MGKDYYHKVYYPSGMNKSISSLDRLSTQTRDNKIPCELIVKVPLSCKREATATLSMIRELFEEINILKYEYNIKT